MNWARVKLCAVTFGVTALMLCAGSPAQDKDVKDVKFACSRHGPDHMQLTLSLEKGQPRTLKFIGQSNGAKWSVTIDGVAAADGNGGQNGDTVKVHSGDKLIWQIAALNHGVAFAEKDLAEAMITFDDPDTDKGPLPMIDLTSVLTSDEWKAFGMKLWGVKPINAHPQPFVMVSGKVK